MKEQSKEQIYIIFMAIWLLWVPHSQTQAQNLLQNPETQNKAAAVKAPVLPTQSPQQKTTHFETSPPVPRKKPEFRVWTEKEIRSAQNQCKQILENWKIIAKPLPAIADYDKCGDAAPLLVSEIYTTWQDKMISVEISPPATLNCKMAGKTAKWLNQSVQKASDQFFTQPVTKIFNVASYHCRKRYNAIAGKMSEHAFANALDISSFQLQDGSKISLIKDWKKEPHTPIKREKSDISQKSLNAAAGKATPLLVSGPALEQIKEPAESVFLKTIHKDACADFSTVLGPESNAAHADHFHLDLGRNGRYQICE